jgi:hypothetical protein
LDKFASLLLKLPIKKRPQYLPKFHQKTVKMSLTFLEDGGLSQNDFAFNDFTMPSQSQTAGGTQSQLDQLASSSQVICVETYLISFLLFIPLWQSDESFWQFFGTFFIRVFCFLYLISAKRDR